jgi:hypothetical protein
MSVAINFGWGPYEWAVTDTPARTRIDGRDKQGNVVHLFFSNEEQVEALDRACLEARDCRAKAKGLPS